MAIGAYVGNRGTHPKRANPNQFSFGLPILRSGVTSQLSVSRSIAHARSSCRENKYSHPCMLAVKRLYLKMSSYTIDDNKAKKRFQEKLDAVGLDVSPYDIPADLWIDDPSKWPDLEWPEVHDYLINTPGVFTREAMKNRKSLESYNQFVSGWVRTVFIYQIKNQNFVILKAQVVPSQRLNEEPHTPWVGINTSSKLVY